MKKIISSVILAMSMCLFSSWTFAAPITHKVDFICPTPNILGNFGNYIVGFGVEVLSPDTINPVYFQSKPYLPGIPRNFNNYRNSNTGYDGATGNITCSFSSSSPFESSFDLTYQVTNGKGGRIVTQTSKTISVLFLIGLDK